MTSPRSMLAGSRKAREEFLQERKISWGEHLYEVHSEIASAIEKGMADLAGELARKHLNFTLQSLAKLKSNLA